MTRHEESLLGDRLTTLATEIEQAVEGLRLPDVPGRHGGIGPLLHQLSEVQALGGRVLNELGLMNAGVEDTPQDRDFMACLATAAVHCAHASTRFTKALAALADAHRAALPPGSMRRPEDNLDFTLGHAAGRRSLKRARNVLEAGATDLTSNASTTARLVPHARTTDPTSPAQSPARRHAR